MACRKGSEKRDRKEQFAIFDILFCFQVCPGLFSQRFTSFRNGIRQPIQQQEQVWGCLSPPAAGAFSWGSARGPPPAFAHANHQQANARQNGGSNSTKSCQ